MKHSLTTVSKKKERMKDRRKVEKREDKEEGSEEGREERRGTRAEESSGGPSTFRKPSMVAPTDRWANRQRDRHTSVRQEKHRQIDRMTNR